MKSFAGVVLVFALLVLPVSNQAVGEESVLNSLPAQFSSYVNGDLKSLLNKPQFQSPIQKAGYECDDCREYCVYRWRYNCGYSPYCTRRFSNCMKSCWRRLCRYGY